MTPSAAKKRRARAAAAVGYNYRELARRVANMDPENIVVWEEMAWCNQCNCHATEDHPEGLRHLHNIPESWVTQKEVGDGQNPRWTIWCRVCSVQSNLAHVKSPEHHQKVAKWYADNRDWVAVTEGTSESMEKFLKTMVQEEKDKLRRQGEDGSRCPVRSLTRKIKTSAHFKDSCRWEILEYLRKFASPRFKDKNQLTGSVRMATGRNTNTKLLNAVDRLNQAWREALVKFNIQMRDPQWKGGRG